MLRYYLIVGVIVFAVSSCSKDKRLERSLRGDWNARKESIDAAARIGPSDSSEYGLMVSATGSCSFNKDGTGICNWAIQNRVMQGQSSIMMQEMHETNKFKWYIEDEHLVIEYGGKCHCNSKQEVFMITNKDDNILICESVTESTVEMDCPMCGGTVREQLRWRITLTRM